MLLFLSGLLGAAGLSKVWIGNDQDEMIHGSDLDDEIHGRDDDAIDGPDAITGTVFD